MTSVLQCDRCEFQVTLPLDDPGTHRYYDLGHGHIAPLETEDAWCHTCHTMRVIEVLPTRAFIDARIKEFTQSLADVDATADASQQQLPYVEFMRQVVASRDAWIAWLPSRIKPVCLTCQSDNIASSGARHDDSWNSASAKPFPHPGCDGMLSYKDTGLCVQYTESHEFVPFSPEGGFLDGPSQWLPTMSEREPGPLTTLQHNPFWVLGATTRDNQRRIIELADEQSLHQDSEVCQKARADLINPRSRLNAELAWLLGVSPTKAVHLAAQAARSPITIGQESGLPPLAHANLMEAALEVMDDEVDPGTMSQLMEQMATLIQRCTVDAIVRDVNEDRAIAGFPLVKTEQVEKAFADRMRSYRNTAKAAFNRLRSVALVEAMTLTVDRATNGGTSQAPAFIDELIDSYEVESQHFLQQEGENVQLLIDAIRKVADSGASAVNPLIDKLGQVVRNWDHVAQPIQLSAKARGTEHSLSHGVAYAIRGLAIDLCNTHGLLTESQRLTGLVQAVFAELPEVKERVEKDSVALEEIVQARKQTATELAEWARDITYQVEIGLLFKHTLRISPAGLQWKNTCYPLPTVTRVRWGGIRQSINGIPSGTSYTVAFGDAQSEAVVELRREEIFSTITQKLWRAVGVRISGDLLKTLQAGQELSFGEAVLRDDQVLLTKHKMFGNDSVWCNWHDTQVWSEDGQFFIGSTQDKKVYVGLSYIHVENVHPLEQTIRVAFKHPGGFSRLSDILA